MKVTIRDIAKKLNLSIGAVSRALDGYPDISEETRQRVAQAALEMGYVPNQAARHLRRQKADAIGYVLPADTGRFADPFFSEFIAGLGDQAASYQLDLVISTAPPEHVLERRLYQAWVQGHKVDGFILNRIRLHDWRVQYLLQTGFPFAAHEKPLDGGDFPSVETDNRDSVSTLVRHITDQGYQRVAFVGGPPMLKIQIERLEGYRDGLAQASLPFDPELIVTGNLTSAMGYQLAMALLSQTDPPDAFVCINDETAFGVMHAVHESGRSVGHEVGVTGFDGVQSAGHSQPPLTTLDQPVYDIARRLVQLLVAEINHQPVPERQARLTPQLLIRQSTLRRP